MPGPIRFFCDKDSAVHYFRFEQIDSTEKLADSYALRFWVYCNEREFLPESAYPDGLEIDGFDDHSSHFAGYHVNGEIAGTARLVHGELEKLPLSEKCEIDTSLLPPGITASNIAEVSRLAVSRSFRRRVTDGPLPDIKPTTDDAEAGVANKRRRRCPELVLGLYKALYHHSRRTGTEYWFAAMEASLAKLLNRFHFQFRQIGPETDYYGPVCPYVASLSDLEHEVLKKAPDLFDGFMEGLEPEYQPTITDR